MILLESHNQAVKDFIWGFMDSTRKSLKIHDFNDIIYCCEEREDGPLAVSIALQSLTLPKDFDWRPAVEAKLAGYPGLSLRAEPIPPYTLTVLLDTETYVPRKQFSANHKSKGLGKDEIKEAYETYKTDTFDQNDRVFSVLSSLRRLVLGAVFEHHFDAAVKEDVAAETEWMTLKAYKGEAVYVRAAHHSVRVIYQMQFPNQEEEIFGRIFAQEFNEARRKLTGIPVPPVTYTTAEPTELNEIVAPSKGREVHFFKFSLERHHLLAGGHREKAIDQLLMFRNYLDYHIKCSKAYMHSRMRFKTAYFLQILNRAEKQADAVGAKKPVKFQPKT